MPPCGDKREGDIPPVYPQNFFKKIDEMSRESTKQLLQEAYIIWHHSRSK